MALEKLLTELKGIDGYLASAIMDFTGEVLATDSTTAKIDLHVVGASFNTLFRSGHDAAGKVGFNALERATLTTPNGIIIMTCSGVNAPVHLHCIAIMKKDGNQALTKMTLEKIMQQATNLLI